MGKKHHHRAPAREIPAEQLFQYTHRAPQEFRTTPVVSPSLQAQRQPSHHSPNHTSRPKYHSSGPPPDPQAVKLAQRIQNFQHMLTPHAAALAAKEDIAPSSPIPTAASSSLPSNVASGGMGVPRAVLAPTKTAQQPLSGALLVRSLMGFDSLVPWAAVAGVFCRQEDCDGNGCPICLEALPTATRITPCGHVYCFPCILRHLKQQQDRGAVRTCPMCAAPLVPNALKRCFLQQVEPIRAKRSVTFVRVQRERRSPMLLCPGDIHLHDSINQFCHAMSSSNHTNNSTTFADAPPLWLPKVEQDASWKFSRYLAPTEEFLGLQQVLDESALEERLIMLERDSDRPWTFDDSEEILSTRDALQRVRSVSTDPSYTFPTTSSSFVHHDSVTHSPPTTAASGGLEEMVDLYVDKDGNQHFLHFVCLKMLRDDCEARGVPMPESITATVWDVEEVVQSDHTRKVLKALSHVPLYGTVRMCFVDMAPLVADTTLKAFREVIDRRRQRLREAARREQEARTHESAADEAWERYKEQRRAQDEAHNGHGGLSPTLEAFALPYDDLPCLELPVSSSYGGSHTEGGGSDGPTHTHRDPSSLETRQRATKGGTAVSGGTAVLSESNMARQQQQGSSTSPSLGPSSTNQWFRREGGAVLDLAPTAIPLARAVPGWAPSAFVDRTGKTMTAPPPKPAAAPPPAQRAAAHLVLSRPAPPASSMMTATNSATSLLSDEDDDSYNPFEELERSLASRRQGGGGGALTKAQRKSAMRKKGAAVLATAEAAAAPPDANVAK